MATLVSQAEQQALCKQVWHRRRHLLTSVSQPLFQTAGQPEGTTAHLDSTLQIVGEALLIAKRQDFGATTARKTAV